MELFEKCGSDVKTDVAKTVCVLRTNVLDGIFDVFKTASGV